MALHNYFWLSQAEINYITVDSYHHCANPGVRLAQPIDRLVVGSSYTSHVPKLQCVGGEKKKSHVHTACACSVPQICSVTLISARYADFSRIKNACHRSHSVWTMTKERQRYSALCLQKLSMHSSIPAKYCRMWPITSNKAMQTVTVKAMLLLTSKLPVMCLNVNITLQWGRKQTWPMQELGACVHSVYQALFPPPPYESAGTRLKFTMTLLYIHKHYHWLPYQPHR